MVCDHTTTLDRSGLKPTQSAERFFTQASFLSRNRSTKCSTYIDGAWNGTPTTGGDAIGGVGFSGRRPQRRYDQILPAARTRDRSREVRTFPRLRQQCRRRLSLQQLHEWRALRAGNVVDQPFPEIWANGFDEFRRITFDDHAVCRECPVHKRGYLVSVSVPATRPKRLARSEGVRSDRIHSPLYASRWGLLGGAAKRRRPADDGAVSTTRNRVYRRLRSAPVARPVPMRFGGP